MLFIHFCGIVFVASLTYIIGKGSTVRIVILRHVKYNTGDYLPSVDGFAQLKQITEILKSVIVGPTFLASSTAPWAQSTAEELTKLLPGVFILLEYDKSLNAALSMHDPGNAINFVTERITHYHSVGFESFVVVTHNEFAPTLGAVLLTHISQTAKLLKPAIEFKGPQMNTVMVLNI